jgi:hypothetical protein
LTPANGTYSPNIFQNFTVNLTDNLGIKNATLFIYNQTGLYDENTYTNFAVHTLQSEIGVVSPPLLDNTYQWFYVVRDWAGNSFTSDNNTIIIDTTYPKIRFGVGTAESGANLSQNFIYVTVQVTVTNLANITYTLKNLTGFVNVTTYTTPIYTINWTNLPDTDYTYYVNITNLINYINGTVINKIRLDTTAPNATLLTPANGTYTTDTSINLTVNLTDNLGIKNATVFVYNQTGLYNQTEYTNFAVDTLQSVIGVVITFVDNTYQWFYTVRDWASNSFTSGNNTIIIDTTPPTINYTAPTTPAGGPQELRAIWANITATDTNLAYINASLELIIGPVPYAKNSVSMSVTKTPTDSLYNNWTGLSQGIYKISGYATDILNYVTYLEYRTVNIDTEPPIINYVSPTEVDGAVIPLNTFTINVTAEDPNLANITIYYWYLNGTVNAQTIASYANISTNTLVQSLLLDGLYYYNASAFDTQSRASWLATRSVNVQHANQTLALCKELYMPGATYIVTTDLTSVGTCLNVTASSITVWCQGHIITGNDAVLANKLGLTLRDCVITSPLKAGLRIKGNSPSSVTVYNCTFKNSPYGIIAAPESNLYANSITVTDNEYGIYFNYSNNGNTINNVIMSGNSYDSITFMNSSYNTVTSLTIGNSGDLDNNGVIVFNTSTDNYFNGCTISALNAKLWGLYDYSINNLLQSCYYNAHSQDYVDGTSQLIRRWPFKGSVVDKALNKMQGAVINFEASNPTNKDVTYKFSGMNITYGTLSGSMPPTDSQGLTYINIIQYMNIFGTEYSSSPYKFNATYGVFAPANAVLVIDETDATRYHQFILGDEIASTSLSRTAMWIILGIVFLIGVAASVGFFIVRMREGYSVVDIWKYFIILVIWLTIFMVIYYALAWFIMGTYYPKI